MVLKLYMVNRSEIACSHFPVVIFENIEDLESMDFKILEQSMISTDIDNCDIDGPYGSKNFEAIFVRIKFRARRVRTSTRTVCESDLEITGMTFILGICARVIRATNDLDENPDYEIMDFR